MTQIAYFSGTGNSLMVAKELAARLEGATLVPMVKAIRKGRAGGGADRLILVFPTYLMTLPLPVRQYLGLLDRGAAAYVAAVATCERKGNLTALTVARLLRARGLELSYHAEVEMPQNSPTGLMPTKGDAGWARSIREKNTDAGFQAARASIASIAADLAAAKRAVGGRGFGAVILESLISAASKNNTSRLAFYSDPTCTGCGICERICPTGRIAVADGRVAWDRDEKCYYCFACFNACPTQSILLKNYALKEGRYVNRAIAVQELIGQK